MKLCDVFNADEEVLQFNLIYFQSHNSPNLP